MHDVTVIIPAWNALHRLERTLSLLEAQSRRPEQVVVVDNASTDGTSSTLAATFPWVEVVRLPRNKGTSGGVNAGVRAARGAFLVTLDSDAYPSGEWLERLVGALEEDRRFSFAACRLLLAADPTRIDSAGDAFDPLLGGVMRGFGEPDGPRFDEPREVFSATGAASAYRREVFERVGWLDESLFIYSDDVDFGFRARLGGFRCLYVPDAIAHHERSVTFGRGTPRQTRLIYRNRVTVYLKDMPWELVRPRLKAVARTWGAALVHAPHRCAALRGYVEALLRLPQTLKKRRRIQRTRVVSPEALLGVMSPDGLPVEGRA